MLRVICCVTSPAAASVCKHWVLTQRSMVSCLGGLTCQRHWHHALAEEQLAALSAPFTIISLFGTVLISCFNVLMTCFV